MTGTEVCGVVEPAKSKAQASAPQQIVQHLNDLLKRGLIEEALNDAEAARQRFPQVPAIAAQYARCLAARGDVVSGLAFLIETRIALGERPVLAITWLDLLQLAGFAEESRIFAITARQRFVDAPGLQRRCASVLEAVASPDKCSEAIAQTDDWVLLLAKARYRDARHWLSEATGRVPDRSRRLLMLAEAAFAAADEALLLGLVEDYLAAESLWHQTFYHVNALARKAVAAGRPMLAQQLYRLCERAYARLTDCSLAAFLEQLWHRLDESIVGPARLERAWKLANCSAPRQDWEQQARWSQLCLAAMQVWDLGRRDPDRAEQYVAMIGPPDWSLLGDRGANGSGALLVTAHLSSLAFVVEAAFTAIPTLWELVGREAPEFQEHAQQMISTVAGAHAATRRVLQKLRAGQSVIMAPDGFGGPHQYRFDVGAASVSDLPTALVFRHRIDSFWLGGHWQDGRVQLSLQRLPEPAPGESYEDFRLRWYEAYFSQILLAFQASPRNIGFAGTLWYD